jgi:signal transduction histidine kinase
MGGLVFGEYHIVHVRQPILLSDNSVGYLQYGLSMELLRNAARRSLKQGALLIGISLLIGTVLILLLGIPVVNRISLLITASEALSKGDYQQVAPEEGADEIARLAHYFNIMSNAIRQRILALEESRVDFCVLNQELEWRVEERTQQLARVNRTLEETIVNLKQTQESLIYSEKLASLGSLVAGIAHELNTPIGNALMAASTLEERSHEFIVEVEKGLKRSALDKYLSLVGASCPLITRNLYRATELITSFKHVAVDQSSSVRRKFSLQQIVCEVSDTLRHTFKNSAIKLEIDIPENIMMDSYPGALGQIITNLITNALTHAFSDGRAGCMRFYAYQSDDNRVMLEFSDDGMGIAPEHLKHIFDPFFTTRLGRGGSGLGLSIVHNIVEAVLGGRAQVKSVLGQGTCFSFDLPLYAPNEG